jgi:hypothetical protein
LAAVNVGQMRLRNMLKILEVEGAIERAGSSWRRTSSPWSYDEERQRRVTEVRRAEQAAMETYGRTGKCLMEFLLQQLDDPGAEPCGRCMVCTGAVGVGPQRLDGLRAASSSLDRVDDFEQVGILVDVVPDAGLERLDEEVLVERPRDDDLGGRKATADVRDDLDTDRFRQPEADDHHFDLSLLEERERLSTARADVHDVDVAPIQGVPEGRQGRRPGVRDDEHALDEGILGGDRGAHGHTAKGSPLGWPEFPLDPALVAKDARALAVGGADGRATAAVGRSGLPGRRAGSVRSCGSSPGGR